MKNVRLAIFFQNKWCQTSGFSPEIAMAQAQELLGVRLTYCPANGLVYSNSGPGHIPCGLLY